MTSKLSPELLMLAAQMAERHRIPESTVTHPAVIVPNNPFMTEKLQDKNYVPYCARCTLCYRLRRTEFGFECPNCHTQANFDLTPYNGNVGVQYVTEEPK